MVLEPAVSSPCPGLAHTGLPVLNLLPVLESVFFSVDLSLVLDWENRAALTFQQRGGAVKALSPKARSFCDRQVVPTEGGLRGSLLHAVPVP